MRGNRQPEDQQASSSPRSRLLQLPKELQLNIWEYALTEQDPIPFFTTGSPHTPGNPRRSRPKTLRWYIPPLLQACRTCRIEGLPVFYASNIFILEHEPIFDDFDQAHNLFERYWHHLASITDFGMCDVAMGRAGLLGLKMCRGGVLLLLDLRLLFYVVLFYCA